MLASCSGQHKGKRSREEGMKREIVNCGGWGCRMKSARWYVDSPMWSRRRGGGRRWTLKENTSGIQDTHEVGTYGSSRPAENFKGRARAQRWTVRGSDASSSYKMNYHLMLQECVRGLVAAGCDGGGRCRMCHGYFLGAPSMIMDTGLAASKGPLIEVLMRFWPDPRE
ncbi:hypothetical protein BGY98DRAFT_1178533 [Russula aff. rugulosa BPL654]|nr:hypothetical protein BGY98DRAFT_1178533 [Russula aff. rugulosa BPL654]